MLDKTICALSTVFIGSSGSTFTEDIIRLRRGWESASHCDEYLCQGELPNYIAENEWKGTRSMLQHCDLFRNCNHPCSWVIPCTLMCESEHLVFSGLHMLDRNQNYEHFVISTKICFWVSWGKAFVSWWRMKTTVSTNLMFIRVPSNGVVKNSLYAVKSCIPFVLLQPSRWWDLSSICPACLSWHTQSLKEHCVQDNIFADQLNNILLLLCFPWELLGAKQAQVLVGVFCFVLTIMLFNWSAKIETKKITIREFFEKILFL